MGRLTLFFLLLLISLPFSQAAELTEVIDLVRPGVVAVGTVYPPRQSGRRGEAVSYLGTGFVVADGLYIVTNAHVLPARLDTEKGETVAVFSGRGEQASAHPARVVSTDGIHDLALLKIVGEPLPALEIGSSDEVREGQEVAFTGFPMGMVLGLYPVTHRGIIAAITPIARPAENARTLTAAQLKRMRNPFEAFQLDAVAYPGSSGSPVYDAESGRVVAIINSVFIQGSREALLERPSGISYAIPAAHIQRLIESALSQAAQG